jgi:hypothetical protein
VAEAAEVVRVQRLLGAAVVDAEVPVAVRPVRRGRAGAAEDDRDRSWEVGELRGEGRYVCWQGRAGHWRASVETVTLWAGERFDLADSVDALLTFAPPEARGI